MGYIRLDIGMVMGKEIKGEQPKKEDRRSPEQMREYLMSASDLYEKGQESYGEAARWLARQYLILLDEDYQWEKRKGGSMKRIFIFLGLIGILCFIYIRLYSIRFEDGIIYAQSAIFEQDFNDKGIKKGNMILGGVHLSEWPRSINDDYKWFQPQYMKVEWVKHYVVNKSGGEVNFYLIKAEYPIVK